MKFDPTLSRIRRELFYGSAKYTKNQPDLFVPHRFQLVAPSGINAFIETLKEDVRLEKELLIYLHLPFCFSECLFCNSFPHKVNKELQEQYLTQLVAEIDSFSKSGIFEGKRARCIYFGGGTPTAFTNDGLRRILDKVRAVIELDANCNISAEAHPVTLQREERIAELAEIGFNRLSIGCQTFDAGILKHCKRANTAGEIAQVVTRAQRNGISINVDMMTGLPGQTIASVQADLNILGEIRPDAVEYIRHEVVNPSMSRLYGLHPELRVNDDDLFEMVFMTQSWMADNGYEQNGRYSKDSQWAYRFHWLHEMPIIAFGSRTRSYSRGICYDKHDDLNTYGAIVNKGMPPVGRYMLLSQKEQMFRSFILGLQLTAGVNIPEFSARYEQDPTVVFAAILEKLLRLETVSINEESIRLTPYGACFVEDVCDCIIDMLLKEETGDRLRTSHSGGTLHNGPVPVT